MDFPSVNTLELSSKVQLSENTAKQKSVFLILQRRAKVPSTEGQSIEREYLRARRLRIYLYEGERTGKRGRPKTIVVFKP